MFAVGLAIVLGEWWPLALCGLMVAAGLALDVIVLDRFLTYQPGWAALPIGLAELGLTMTLARLLDVTPPLSAAIAFFAGAWLLAQILGHGVFPLVHHAYADDGGELGRAGPALGGLALVGLAVTAGAAHATRPPYVVLERGVHGPLVLDRPQRLVAQPGAVVRGGVRITSDDVELVGATVHAGRSGIEVTESERVRLVGVTVIGGENGIEVRDSEAVVLDRVVVRGARMDGITARESAVTIRDCSVVMRGPQTHGIELSFSMAERPSRVERCDVSGGKEGIVAHLANVTVVHNRVRATTMRAVSVSEMAMATVASNTIGGVEGVGIFCNDYSHCKIRDNVIRNARPDASGSLTRLGFGVVAAYHATAEIEDNRIMGSTRPATEFSYGTLVRE